MILTKRYRLIWDDGGIIQGQWDWDYEESITSVGYGVHSFESNDLNDIEEKIQELELILPEED